MSMLKGPQAGVLARVMSGLSEEYYCAGWLIGCEYALWADMTGNEVAGVHGWKITAEEIEELRLLHEWAGGWVVWSDEVGGQIFLSDSEWLEHLANSSLASTELPTL